MTTTSRSALIEAGHFHRLGIATDDDSDVAGWLTTRPDAQLRRPGARISGVDIAGRHFFIHPDNTAGLLIELTDTEFADDPRDGPVTERDGIFRWTDPDDTCGLPIQWVEWAAS
jgi:hypothetical protein